MPKKKNDTAIPAPAPASFEAALHRLEDIVSQLERGEAPLEAALSLYEEGVALARFCSSQVRDAERRVMLLEDKNGELTARSFVRSGEGAASSQPEEVEDDADESDQDEGDEESGTKPENQEQLF